MAVKFVLGREGELPEATVTRTVLELVQHRSCSSCPHILRCLGACEWHGQVLLSPL